MSKHAHFFGRRMENGFRSALTTRVKLLVTNLVTPVAISGNEDYLVAVLLIIVQYAKNGAVYGGH